MRQTDGTGHVPLLERLWCTHVELARRFKQETGTTPHRWLTHQRILSAQQLLEKSDRPIDWIAESVGLQRGATLRKHFRRMLKTTPTA